MKDINRSTKKAQGMINSYDNAKYEYLYQCYEKPSQNKLDAERLCRDGMVQRNGYDFRITGYSIHTFSCAYRYRKNIQEYLVYHTHLNCYRIAL